MYSATENPAVLKTRPGLGAFSVSGVFTWDRVLLPFVLAVAVALLTTACTSLSPSNADPTASPTYSGTPDSYVAVAPSVLNSGQTNAVSVSLFDGTEPARGRVRLTLAESEDGVPLVEATEDVTGNAPVQLAVPPLDEGAYLLRLTGMGAGGTDFEHVANVEVRAAAPVLFLETDKPIYKPGQQVHFRVLRLDNDLRPLPGAVTVEVQDAKGFKVYRQTMDIDGFGMADSSLPLSGEPNLGAWTLKAKSGDQTVQVDVRVEEYVLPKYEVEVDLPREWVLADEAVVGTISAEYSFGKPVRGDVEIVAFRYVGVWEEYARFDGPIDGEAAIELPSADYVAGTPADGGQGNLRLDVTVRERSTGYVEQTSRLLTVATAPVNLQLVPESSSFKPGLPFSVLLVAETPDNRPVETEALVEVTYYGEELEVITEEPVSFQEVRGSELLELRPPDGAVAVEISARTLDEYAFLALKAGYSPSGNFIHVEQVDDTRLEVGDRAAFRVHSTEEASTFYYDVTARGRMVFSGISRSPEIAFDLTPEMAPSARLLVYQVLPNNEVAADYIPFDVAPNYPMQVGVDFGVQQAAPGEVLDISVTAEGTARVGLAAVDRSVYILAENRLNLRQVFDELERLYAEPRAEVHLEHLQSTVASPGAADTIRHAGMMVMSDKPVPEGETFSRPIPQPSIMDRVGLVLMIGIGITVLLVILGSIVGIVAGMLYGLYRLVKLLAGGLLLLVIVLAVGVGCASSENRDADEASASVQMAMAPQPTAAPAGIAGNPAATEDTQLAEVQRVRQYFPETWLWTHVTTDETGSASIPATAPDSITTWKMRAVGVSPEHGLGIGESELVVLQPFFLQLDLPYSAIRGEEFPVRVSLYNYLDTTQEFFVELEESENFALLGEGAETVTVEPNDVGAIDFDIRLTELGSVPIKVTARSREAADAVIERLLVEPEGVEHEVVHNAIVPAGEPLVFDVLTPAGAIPGSGRAFVNLSGSYVAQTLEGLENLLQMPYGCGEQNMILFAPNIYVARYLEATGQVKPEVMAKAEFLMTTGYQRELIYRRSDGSFSAFGQSDEQGSLWLTAFVLKSFAQADGLIYVDEAVLAQAREWIRSHQRGDGSFEPVGFVHHQELLGGLRGSTALTAYVAIALMEAGDFDAASRALAFLESQVEGIDDRYAMSIAAYALALGDSPTSSSAYERLMEMAVADGDGLRWGGAAAVETTGYATLALLQHGDFLNASRATRWLVGQRNPQGGFGSTQDTVVGLQALIESAQRDSFDVDATIELTSGEWSHLIAIDESNADVVQKVELPEGASLRLESKGLGEVIAQVVQRFNMPEVDAQETESFRIEVDYSADHVAVDDFIDVTARMMFTPLADETADAGMIVLDVAVPTGFAPVAETVEALVEHMPHLKRFDIAGRKVILYIEDLEVGEWLEVEFQARAQYPVRAQPVTSQVYSYYQPNWRGETLGSSMTVEER